MQTPHKNKKRRLWILLAAPAAVLLAVFIFLLLRGAMPSADPEPHEPSALPEEQIPPEEPAVPEEEPPAADAQLYGAALARVRDVARADSDERFLYDLDGDGTQELFLTYAMYAPRADGHDVLFSACSVYTIRDGAPAALLEDLLLQEHAGAGLVNVGVYRIDGTDCFCTHIFSAGDVSAVHRWDIYSYENGALRKTSEVRSFEAADSANSYAVIDGERQSSDAYARWVKGVVTVREMRGPIGRPDDPGLFLNLPAPAASGGS